MALIFEDSEKVTKKQIYIPQNAKKIFKAMGKIYKPYIDKNLDGSKIMKSLSSETQYNKKGDTSNKNGQNKHDSVSVEDAKVRLHRQEKLNPNSVEYQLYGGQLAHDILKKGIEGARGVKTVDAVKPPKPTVSKPNVSKDLKKDRSKMKLSNPKIKLESRKINESSYEESTFYKYLEEYDEGYVLNKFAENPHGKQDWGVLINPSMYEKALQEFTRYGHFQRFPTKYIYQWIGIIMRNTAILIANTNLAGHSNSFSYDTFLDFIETYYNDRNVFLDDNNDVWLEISGKEILLFMSKNKVKFPINEENGIHKNGQYDLFMNQDQVDAYDKKKEELDAIETERKKNALLKKRIQTAINNINQNNRRYRIEKKDDNYYLVGEIFDVLDDIGLYEWMVMPDGSDAWSDYGLEPLMEIINEYNSDLSPEKVIVIVNKALDVYHQRGDMASIFVEGGTKALSKISECKGNKERKIYIRENQLLKLNAVTERTDLPRKTRNEGKKRANK